MKGIIHLSDRPGNEATTLAARRAGESPASHGTPATETSNPGRNAVDELETMCGIAIVAAVKGTTPTASPDQARAMRDLLTARGPDDEGFWTDGQVHIGHRRLAISSPASNRQPWVLDGPMPLVLAFNGELYDCAELRAELEARGHRFTLGSDTELLAHAVLEWGDAAPQRVRGMFAYVAWLPTQQTLLMARDALGIVPLHMAILGREVVVASEARSILAHPGISPEPDWLSVMTYLNSLRTTRDEFTLFAGIECLRAGERATVRLDGERPRVVRSRWWHPPSEEARYDEESAAAMVRETVERSIAAHLISDVPLCSLLSGGLDSSIVAAIARRSHPDLRTYCAGERNGQGDDDLAIAAQVAQTLDTRHQSVHVSRDRFLADWPTMVEALGVPLSTPNEVAIRAVSLELSRHAKVTLSGEGADELFAGYGPPLEEAERWIAQARTGAGPTLGAWQATTFGWVPPSLLGSLLAPEIIEPLGGSQGCARQIEQALAAAFERCGDPLCLRTHLDVQRSLNLPSLLQRLNTASMLASVEGRTPFADIRVAELAASLPLSLHYPSEDGRSDAGGTALATLPRTKRLLRRAFADVVPQAALLRPKASFPLPFQGWLDGATSARHALRSAAARTVFRPEAIEFLDAQPTEHWRVAWPALNLALWLQRWWS
jgi:asparagine synthase (glutamine-hydrolysing)